MRLRFYLTSTSLASFCTANALFGKEGSYVFFSQMSLLKAGLIVLIPLVVAGSVASVLVVVLICQCSVVAATFGDTC